MVCSLFRLKPILSYLEAFKFYWFYSAFIMPMMAVLVVVANYSTIIFAVYHMVNVRQIVASYNPSLLPYLISDDAVSAFSGNGE